MKNEKILILFVVGIALAGFICCSTYNFYTSFSILEDGKLPDNYAERINASISYITAALTGLVGSIVASAFGVPSDNPVAPVEHSTQAKLQKLGSWVATSSMESNRETLGFVYALAYMLVGLASVIIWAILGENAIQNISNMATTFIGMIIPIVGSFFASAASGK